MARVKATNQNETFLIDKDFREFNSINMLKFVQFVQVLDFRKPFLFVKGASKIIKDSQKVTLAKAVKYTLGNIIKDGLDRALLWMDEASYGNGKIIFKLHYESIFFADADEVVTFSFREFKKYNSGGGYLGGGLMSTIHFALENTDLDNEGVYRIIQDVIYDFVTHLNRYGGKPILIIEIWN